jgi:23S rRNA (cytosine1962-C5)-methyltransferase
MTDRAAHELIDAGDGRRLERFGELVVDRPAPMADDPPRDPEAWSATDLRFDRYVGWTSVADTEPQPWVVEDGDLRLELRPTDTGQVGLFPEQAPNRAWVRSAIAEMIASAVPSSDPMPSLLNLFAYTGATTLSGAAAGANVAHVDGSRPAVAWARRNAELSGLADRPIRWLVDDVETFVGREIRRGRRYDAVILDPPSYGHGSRGATWRLEDRLDPLLDACAELTGDDPAFVLLTAHTPGFGPDRLADALAGAFGRRQSEVEAGELGLRARSGAHLRLGAWARIIRE